MLKQMLGVKGAQKLAKNEQLEINGGIVSTHRCNQNCSYSGQVCYSGGHCNCPGQCIPNDFGPGFRCTDFL